MKNYKKMFRMSTILLSLGMFFMTMLVFIQIVYVKDMEDIMRDPFSMVVLRAPLYIVSMLICYIPGVILAVYANKYKVKAREESLRID